MLLTLQSWFVVIGSSSREEGIEVKSRKQGYSKGRRERERFRSDWPTRMGVVYPDRGWEMRVEAMGGAMGPNFSPLPSAHLWNAAARGLVPLRGPAPRPKTVNGGREQ